MILFIFKFFRYFFGLIVINLSYEKLKINSVISYDKYGEKVNKIGKLSKVLVYVLMLKLVLGNLLLNLVFKMEFLFVNE